MQTLTRNARSLRLLAHLNADRLLMSATLIGALALAGQIARFIQ